MKTIAVIDDDVYIGNMLEEVLLKEDYKVLRAYSGTEALYLLTQNSPDLILLDLMLPGLSGEEVLLKLKTTLQDIPVIVVSAKVEIEDKVNLLLNGASDFITKPFNIKELLARITVQLRNTVPSGKVQLLSYNNLTLNVDTHEVHIQNTPVKLTRTEYAILKILMQDPKLIKTKSSLLDQISEDTPDCTESSLKIHISNLRKKLREINGTEYIEAVWGIGFKLKE